MKKIKSLDEIVHEYRKKNKVDYYLTNTLMTLGALSCCFGGIDYISDFKLEYQDIYIAGLIAYEIGKTMYDEEKDKAIHEYNSKML
jgi:hypothetical protein